MQQPAEVSVIVFQAHGLVSKKKAKHKYNVTFSVGDQKAKSEPVDCEHGDPAWNSEAQLDVKNPFETLVIKVKDKEEILGCVTLEMHEIPTERLFRPRRVPLRAHKKSPNPKGEITFEAWISHFTEGNAEIPDVKKGGGLSRLKGAISGSKGDLSKQNAKLGAVRNSSESLASTVSGTSAVSEATKAKKSTLKKLKGVMKKAPSASADAKLTTSKSSMSCMDLSNPRSDVVAHLPPLPDRRGSRESLNSRGSDHSNVSGAEKKKTKNPFKKLKDKVSRSPYTARKEFSLSKKSSQSMSDLAFEQGITVREFHGSNESLEIKAQSSMGKGFPEKFDLTVPKTLLNMSPSADNDKPDEPVKKALSESQDNEGLKVPTHKRTLSDTPSWKNSPENSPKPEQRKRLSIQKRTLLDTPGAVQYQEDDRGAEERGGGYFVRQTLGRGSGISVGSSHSSNREEPILEESKQEEEKEGEVDDLHPEISGVSPSQATCEGGTRLTIRGEKLGNAKDDIVKLSVCGTNCLPSLQYMSEYKIHCTTKATNPGTGKIIVETESGGRGVSLVDFVFLESETPPVVTAPPPKPPRQSKLEQSPVADKKSKGNDESVERGKSYRETEAENPAHVFDRKDGNRRKQDYVLSSNTSQSRRRSSNNDSAEDVSGMPAKSPFEESSESETDKGNKKKISPGFEDFVREDPEGMPTSKEASPDFHRNSEDNTPFSKGEPVKNQVTDLRVQIKTLQGENSALKDENRNLKGYLDRLMVRIVAECPHILCIDDETSRTQRLKSYTKTSH